MDSASGPIDLRYSFQGADDQSTSALINDHLGHSTSSLLKKDIQDLLKDAIVKERRHEDNTSVSIHLQNLPYFYEGREHRMMSLAEASEDTELKQERGAFLFPHLNDSYFQMLFNKTQVLLLRNELSLDFLVILKRYINLLLKDDENPMEDQYVLELQNELDKGLVLTPRIFDLLDVFLSNPSNPLMLLAQLEQRKRKMTLESVFTRWKLLTKVDLNLMQLSLVWNGYIERKYLKVWQHKMVLKCRESQTEADCLLNFKGKSNSFDMWIKRTDAQKVKQDLADVFFLQKYLTILKEESMDRISSINSADLKFRKTYLRRAFSSLKLRSRQRLFEQREASNVKKLYFERLAYKFQRLGSLSDKAMLLAEHLILTPFVNIWKARLAEKSLKMRELAELETLFRDKMALKVVRDVMEWKDRENHAILCLNAIVLRHVLRNVWLKRIEERQALHAYRSQRGFVTMKKLFMAWREQVRHTSEAFSVYERGVVNRSFHLLIRTALMMRLKRRSQEKLLRELFLRWCEVTKFELMVAEFHQKLLKRFWSRKLRGRYRSLIDLSLITVKCRDSLLVREKFGKWSSSVHKADQLSKKADLFRRVTTIAKLKKVLLHSERLEAMSRSYKSQSDSKHKKKFMSIWLSSMRIQLRLKQEIILDQYLTLKENSLARSFMAIWTSRFQYLSLTCTRLADDQRFHVVTTSFFQKAFDRIQLHENWRLVAVKLHNQSTLSNTFENIKLKIGQVSAMQHDLVRLRSERELSFLMNCMNLWTMKQLKCSRNSETVEIFKNRWNRASLRAILLLWREKTASGTTRQSDLAAQTYDERPDQDERGLITPTRIKTSGRITIPGSEKMKQNRMEAMKNHYRRARKAIPSPIRFSEKLDTVTKRRLETNATDLEQRGIPPPPKMDLEKINKKLASRKPTISFKSIPEAKLSPATSPRNLYAPVIDRSLLSQHNVDLDRSPSIR
ncbi:LAME_0C02828g1_1 [Lachancea meyersii CBS 8951]|uniref:LAME_0C02828g1_1 n=1 Tax=Lachancea meyersii CBS 8951 TaxID=1266667 RepID=A0A1G4IZV9_9SACH|nr:LAME_0C02828g1_1 [Lachancea meyersii CBS 8951]